MKIELPGVRVCELEEEICPVCGAQLEYIEPEGRELRDGDYFTPNSYEIDYYVYRCPECGETIKTRIEI